MRNSQINLSASATPQLRRGGSQMSIHDMPNLNQLSCTNFYLEEELTSISVMTTQAPLAVKEIMRQITHRAGQIIYDKHLETMLPEFAIHLAKYKVAQIMQSNYVDVDDSMIDLPEHGIYEDYEPTPVNIENWRRFQGMIHNPKQQTEPAIQKDSKQSTKTVFIEFKRQRSERQDREPIKMGEIEDIEFDPEVESIRQAKLRQIAIQQQKDIYDKQKIHEVMEQAKQLKRLNIDSKSLYTFDFEGKVVIQKPPDMERYPKSHLNILEKRNLVEVKDMYPDHRKICESVQNGKKGSMYQINNQFTQRTYVPQIELIALKQGVTFYEGKNEKKNERVYPLIDIKDQSVLSQTLQSQDCHMSKQEYMAITNQNNSTGMQYNPNVSNLSNQSNKNLKIKSESNVKYQGKTEPEYYQNTETNRQSLAFHNQSLSQSVFKLNGSISISVDQNLEDLIVDGYPQYSDQKLPEKRLPSPKVELPNIPQQALRNNKLILPKGYLSAGTLPKLLPKYPRERIIKKALILRIND